MGLPCGGAWLLLLCAAAAAARGPPRPPGAAEVSAAWLHYLPPAALDPGNFSYPAAPQCQPCLPSGTDCCTPRSALPKGQPPDKCPAGHLCCDSCGAGQTSCSCDPHPCFSRPKARIAAPVIAAAAAPLSAACCALCGDHPAQCAAATYNGTHCLFHNVTGPTQKADGFEVIVVTAGVQRQSIRHAAVLPFPIVVTALLFMGIAFGGYCAATIGQYNTKLRRRHGEIIVAPGSREPAGYTWLRVFARGGFASVVVVQRVRDGKELAMKEIVCANREDQEYARTEGRILDQFQGHPNMVVVTDRFFLDRPIEQSGYGAAASSGSGRQQGNEVARYCIVMDYYTDGDLNRYLEEVAERRGQVEEHVLRGVVMQVCQLLHHLHQGLPAGHGHQGPVIHRDLKPQNILIRAREPGGGLRIVVTDFGLARLQERTYVYTQAGSMPYMAPECWRRRYGKEVDIWSVGCIAYVMATLRVRSGVAEPARQVRCLFAEAHDAGFSEGVRREVLGRGYNTAVAGLVCDCLQHDPRSRPTAEEIVTRLGGSLTKWAPEPVEETPESPPPRSSRSPRSSVTDADSYMRLVSVASHN